MRLAAGDRAGALAAYEESLAIRRKLAASDPGNAGWQRDLSVSLNKVGDVRLAAGDRAGALSAYEESLAIRRKLAASDPGNAGWQRDLSVSLDKVGDVRLAAGDRAGALSAYEESLAIRRKLAAADPGNAGWQRDLSVSLNKVGDVRLAAGDRAGRSRPTRKASPSCASSPLLHDVELDLGDALPGHAERLRGGMRDVDHPSVDERTAIVDADRDGLARWPRW